VRKQAEQNRAQTQKKIPREKGRKAERNQRSTPPSSSSLHKKNQPKTEPRTEKKTEKDRACESKRKKEKKRPREKGQTQTKKGKAEKIT
jgi:hypothetical protein